MVQKHTVPFANGDDGAARVAKMVIDQIFSTFPFKYVPLNVEARLDTEDDCLQDAARAFLKYGTGIKISTASNDSRILAAGLGSLNIKMRPMLGAYAIFRFLQGPGKYKHPAAVLRYAYGGFYNEQSCEVQELNGRKTLVTVQHTDIADFHRYVKLAYDKAKEHNLHIIIATKRTIAESEKQFYLLCAEGLKNLGMEEGKNLDQPGGVWTGDFHHELTDDNETRLAISAAGTNTHSNGGFLLMVNNVDGDGRSDVVNAQHGGYLMGSEVYCCVGEKEFSYHELPTGTGESFAEGPFPVGERFFNPTAIIFTVAAGIEKTNPGYKMYFDAVRIKTLSYIKRTPPQQWDTQKMIAAVAKYSFADLPTEAVAPAS